MTGSTAEIMALAEVRTANEAGRAVVVLDAALDTVLFANTAAARLFAIAAGAPRAVDDSILPASAARRIAALEPILREDGEALLRLKGGSEGLEVWVTAHVFLAQAGESEIALLTAPVPGSHREDAEGLAGRLLAESGLNAGAIVIDTQAAVRARTADLSDIGEADLQHRIDAALATVEEGRTSFTLASDLVLLLLPQAPVPAVPDDAPAAPASPIGAILDRWRSRTEEGAAPDEAPVETVELPVADPEIVASETMEADASTARLPLPSENVKTFSARLDAEPTRFVWQIDADGRFRQLSPEFASIVGPAAADVLGVAFSEVAEAFGFDEKGEIAGLLERRDTWSGRSVLWPVQGTDRKVVVDLAALPVYDRERNFDGFRGFGVVRPAESVEDPEAIGLMLVADVGDDASAPDADDIPVEDAGEDEAGMPGDDAVCDPAFGRRAEPPLAATAEPLAQARPEPAAPDPTVVRLEERRRRDALLSPSEADAFKAIGAELSPEAKAEAALREERTAAPVFDADLAQFFKRLPVAVLLEWRGELAFANPAFLEWSGYASVEALAEAGGLETLFGDQDVTVEREPTLSVLHRDGHALASRVQMQRISLKGRSYLAFYFLAAAPDETPAAPAVPEDTSARDAQLGILQDEVEELRSVLDTATDGILLLHPSGDVRSMNGSAEALFGLRAPDYAGLPFVELLAPESRSAAQNYLETLREEGLAGILNDGREVQAQVPGGGSIPLFVTIGRLAGDRGWCVVLRDIAHWKRAEEELVAARRQAEDASLHKSRFLANISHELRTPLNAIIGFADVMTSETYGPVGHERYMEYLSDIKRSGHHVLDLVNDLLDISKIEAGKVELAFESVLLNDVVSEVVSLMQPQANRERVIVRSNLPGGVPPVVADRRTLRQIALNLLSNAIRFTPAGGQIIASTSYGEDGEVALRFRDSGIGMTDREIEIALTPFQQVNAVGQERGEGTGLGLPLTKAMVEANRAQFRISSSPGDGTLIEITFPAQRVLAH